MHTCLCASQCLLDVTRDCSFNTIPVSYLSAGAVGKVAVAAPFKMLYFSVITASYVGPHGLLLIYTFFIIGAAVQRSAYVC